MDAPRYTGRVPGRVVRISRSEGWVDVLTGDGVLRVHEVQPDGGHAVPAATLIRSLSDTLGMRSSDLVQRIDLLERRLHALEARLAEMTAERRP